MADSFRSIKTTKPSGARYELFIPKGDDPAEVSSHRDTLRRMYELLNNGILDERAKEILRLRYGLDGKGARSLKQIGEQFDITRERVRQIETESLRKLREKMVGTED